MKSRDASQIWCEFMIWETHYVARVAWRHPMFYIIIQSNAMRRYSDFGTKNQDMRRCNFCLTQSPIQKGLPPPQTITTCITQGYSPFIANPSSLPMPYQVVRSLDFYCNHEDQAYRTLCLVGWSCALRRCTGCQLGLFLVILSARFIFGFLWLTLEILRWLLWRRGIVVIDQNGCILIHTKI